MDDQKYRKAHDSLGEVRVPADALWGAQTQRAIENFDIAGEPMPAPFIHALGLVKWAAAVANGRLGELDPPVADAVAAAALEVAEGRYDAQFPVDLFQTGSGTSSNMNANEVIARLAVQRLGRAVHPNDDVNRGQSSNDTVPTAIHVAARLQLHRRVLPALEGLASAIEDAATRAGEQLKTGRTHLMDALPMYLASEFGAWRSQLHDAAARLRDSDARLRRLAQGGTAIGSGLNAHPAFGEQVAALLGERTGLAFETAPDRYAALAAQDTLVEFSGQLRVAAVALAKIANDLRWMNSGPLAGLGELRLPALQPGSSIMPGKVNPVVPEAVLMATAAVHGHDTAAGIAGRSGNFQLNTMLPLLAHAVLTSERLVAGCADALAKHVFPGLRLNPGRLEAPLAHNPLLATALNPVVGYDRAVEIAGRAFREGRPVLDIAVEVTGMDRAELARLLDPAHLAGDVGRNGQSTE